MERFSKVQLYFIITTTFFSLVTPQFSNLNDGSTQHELMQEDDCTFYCVNDTLTWTGCEGDPPMKEVVVERDVQFYLYRTDIHNKTDRGYPVSMSTTDNMQHFSNEAPLVMVIHGFGSSDESNFGNWFRLAFENHSRTLNVVFVNWRSISYLPWYFWAARNVPLVGAYAAKFLAFLIDEGKTSIDSIHIIGHSLGSHVASHAGRNVKGEKVSRITGLDPASPWFGKNDRLNSSHAKFVDVIHTSCLGIKDPIGHVDFYPNSGKSQPGCYGIAETRESFIGCSHSRAYEFFQESILDETNFPACKCNNWNEYKDGKCSCTEKAFMGWHANRSVGGTFYLQTNNTSPFDCGVNHPPAKCHAYKSTGCAILISVLFSIKYYHNHHMF